MQEIEFSFAQEKLDSSKLSFKPVFLGDTLYPAGTNCMLPLLRAMTQTSGAGLFMMLVFIASWTIIIVARSRNFDL
jgi:hypothetical protein